MSNTGQCDSAIVYIYIQPIIFIYDNVIFQSSTTGVSYSILSNVDNQEVSHDLPVQVRNPSYGNVAHGNESQEMETWIKDPSFLRKT